MEIIYNGIYTVDGPQRHTTEGRVTLPTVGRKSHHTYKIATVNTGALQGHRVIGILCGPDNMHDYLNFGFVTADQIQVWHKFKGCGGEKSKYEQQMSVLMDLINGGARYGHSHRLLVMKHCLRCNLPISRPDSIDNSHGAICMARVGLM